MKAEITLENKAKFFAQYWGQLIVIHPPTSVISHVANHSMTTQALSCQCLFLRPLSSISDEDKKELALLLGYSRQLKDSTLIGLGEAYINQPVREEGIHLYACVCDYLRYKGYALPWMGLSVEEMVEEGWIKLKD